MSRLKSNAGAKGRIIAIRSSLIIPVNMVKTETSVYFGTVVQLVFFDEKDSQFGSVFG